MRRRHDSRRRATGRPATSGFRVRVDPVYRRAESGRSGSLASGNRELELGLGDLPPPEVSPRVPPTRARLLGPHPCGHAPTVGHLSLAPLVACDHVVIPVEAHASRCRCRVGQARPRAGDPARRGPGAPPPDLPIRAPEPSRPALPGGREGAARPHGRHADRRLTQRPGKARGFVRSAPLGPASPVRTAGDAQRISRAARLTRGRARERVTSAAPDRAKDDMDAREATLRAVGLAARWARPVLPLEVRKRAVAAFARRNMPGQVTIGIELLRDLADDDPIAFHHYLWANHLAYAATYELGRFAPGALESDRRVLFELLCVELRRQGIDPAGDVRSVLDVGCSLGYLLRHAETSVFPSAMTLVGIDIDAQAVAVGGRYLRQVGSRAELMVASMEQLDVVLLGRFFDTVVCCGSLMYLDQAEAAGTVASLLGHAHRVVGLIDRAHPHQDNVTLGRSAVRSLDETWIHNLDSMVLTAGGSVASRRWRPPREPGDRGVYLVVAVPPGLDAAVDASTSGQWIPHSGEDRSVSVSLTDHAVRGVAGSERSACSPRRGGRLYSDAARVQGAGVVSPHESSNRPLRSHLERLGQSQHSGVGMARSQPAWRIAR
jgi:SAM-dependent methyltransferase